MVLIYPVTSVPPAISSTFADANCANQTTVVVRIDDLYAQPADLNEYIHIEDAVEEFGWSVEHARERLSELQQFNVQLKEMLHNAGLDVKTGQTPIVIRGTELPWFMIRIPWEERPVTEVPLYYLSNE
jgi:hypothetical protein